LPTLLPVPNPRRTVRFLHGPVSRLAGSQWAVAFPEWELLTPSLQWLKPFLFPAHGCGDSAGLSPDFPFTRAAKF